MISLPLFPIGIISEMCNVHPETVRVWERYGVIKPQSSNRRRLILYLVRF
jgi:DNA-binding transcriptional MerR regulator